jgi:Sporulation and spore germination
VAWGAVTAIGVAAATAFGLACGTGTGDGSSDVAEREIPTQPGFTRTTIYFLTDDRTGPIGVRRTIGATSPYAREALEALLAGPTAEEAENGIATAIPAGTRLLTLTFKRHGADETVNLSGLPPEGGDVLRQLRIITQVARTVIGVSGIEGVWLLNDGRPWGLTLMNGRIDNGPFDYRDLVGWEAGRGCPGTETVTCDRFAALP